MASVHSAACMHPRIVSVAQANMTSEAHEPGAAHCVVKLVKLHAGIMPPNVSVPQQTSPDDGGYAASGIPPSMHWYG